MIALIVAVFEMAHTNFAGFCLRNQFGCRSFFSVILLSAKERLEKGVFSRSATRSGVGADDCSSHFILIEFDFRSLEIPD